MKKILLPGLLTLCGLLLAGCVMTKSDTLRAVPFETKVRPLPLTADLKVSERKARGEASGFAVNAELLTNMATAMALGQNPPSVDKPDVLVGMDRFTEQTGQNLKVIVTGYPAYYTNFRTAEGKGIDMSVVPQTYEVKNRNYYFTPRYQMWQGFDMEVGIAGEGLFGGLDFGMAFDTYVPSVNIFANFGAAFDLPSQLRLAAGLSAGFWRDKSAMGLGGIFARLSWNGIEFSYRLLSIAVVDDGYNPNQFMIGYSFGASGK